MDPREKARIRITSTLKGLENLSGSKVTASHDKTFIVYEHDSLQMPDYHFKWNNTRQAYEVFILTCKDKDIKVISKYPSFKIGNVLNASEFTGMVAFLHRQRIKDSHRVGSFTE